MYIYSLLYIYRNLSNFTLSQLVLTLINLKVQCVCVSAAPSLVRDVQLGALSSRYVHGMAPAAASLCKWCPTYGLFVGRRWGGGGVITSPLTSVETF
jgi:hypothetical protein